MLFWAQSWSLRSTPSSRPSDKRGGVCDTLGEGGGWGAAESGAGERGRGGRGGIPVEAVVRSAGKVKVGRTAFGEIGAERPAHRDGDERVAVVGVRVGDAGGEVEAAEPASVGTDAVIAGPHRVADAAVDQVEGGPKGTERLRHAKGSNHKICSRCIVKLTDVRIADAGRCVGRKRKRRRRRRRRERPTRSLRW